MKLYIGNKKYSSWSFRPWIGMSEKEVEFEEVLVPFNMADGNSEFKKFSPTGKVPCLVDGDLTVWESLAILEYMADRFPDKGFWPENIETRARARSISHEMHGGFSGLRNECPMNMAREHSTIPVSDQVRADVVRVEQIWDRALQSSGGPFLFGEFTIADAMFAPVVNRLEVYCLSNDEAVAEYTSSMKSLKSWQLWEEAGRAEPWIVDEDEA